MAPRPRVRAMTPAQKAAMRGKVQAWATKNMTPAQRAAAAARIKKAKARRKG